MKKNPNWIHRSDIQNYVQLVHRNCTVQNENTQLLFYTHSSTVNEYIDHEDINSKMFNQFQIPQHIKRE